jgi:hypothetical protein
LLKLAVGNGLNLRVAGPKVLEHQNADNGGSYVPDYDLALAGFRFHGSRSQGWVTQSFTELISDKWVRVSFPKIISGRIGDGDRRP